MTSEIISYAKSGLPIQNGSLININYGKTNKSYPSNSNVRSDLDIVNINTKYRDRFDGEIEYNFLGSSNSGASPSLITTNSANFNNCGGNVSTVGTSGRSSYYGAYDMSGNIWEWTDTRIGSTNRVLRGGNLEYNASYMSSVFQTYTNMDSRNQYIGFRIGAYSLSSIYRNMVRVSDINNTADTNGFGSVSYSYYMSKYEISNSEYVEFLNAVAKTDTYQLYTNNMNSSNFGGISRTGISGSYVYTAKENRGNKPVNFIDWFNCARYCNWLHNGKPTGSGAGSSTENGSYTMTDTIIARNNNALFFMLSENEWHKGAYYKGGSTNAGYWLYATQSNTAPNCVQLTSTGDGIPL